MVLCRGGVTGQVSPCVPRNGSHADLLGGVLTPCAGQDQLLPPVPGVDHVSAICCMPISDPPSGCRPAVHRPPTAAPGCQGMRHAWPEAGGLCGRHPRPSAIVLLGPSHQELHATLRAMRNGEVFECPSVSAHMQLGRPISFRIESGVEAIARRSLAATLRI